MNKFVTICILFTAQLLFAFDLSQNQNQYGFIENNGQVHNQDFVEMNEVKYLSTNKNIKLILKDNSFSYQLQKHINNNPDFNINNSFSDNDNIIYKFHRIDVTFLNSNKNFDIVPIGKSEDYINYYNLKNSNKEYVSCYHFKTIKYINVYRNIDFIFYSDSKSNGFKYDIILKPGSDIRDIKLKFNGHENIFLDDSCLNLITSLGDIKESIPESYDSDGKEIEVKYELSNNILSFSAEFDEEKILTIDPLLNYATYFGGSANDVGLEISTDLNDNFVITGFTSSMNNIATTGAYQTEMRGDNDAFIVKYSPLGNRLWATYYGGTGYDTGHGIATDRNGNIVIVGWTKSISNISTSGTHQVFHSGGEFDSYIAKFTASGTRLWCSYYGGQQDDYINDVVIDGYSDIVFIGRTSSLVNIASFKSYQQDLAGSYDAFIVKFSPNGTRKWGTYFGGQGFDVGMEIATDIFNNIAVTGFTQSSGGIAHADAFKTHLSGIWDAFVAKFDKNGNRLWSTYFGGPLEDNGRGVDFDGYGNIYITGNTFSSDSISTSDVHQETISSTESEAFMSKFDSEGDLIWSTYYGGYDEDYGNVATVSPWNQITVAGNTLSSDKISTPGAYKTSHTGLFDVFVCSFFEDGILDFGTYYGGSSNDYSHGITFNKRGDILFTGYTGSTTGIATVDGFQTELAGENDSYIAKLAVRPSIDSVKLGHISGTWCADNFIEIPYTVNGSFSSDNVFIVQLSNASGLFTDFFNIGQVISNQSGTITAYIPKEAITGQHYRVRIVSSEPQIVSPDNGIDITINELPKPVISGESVVCRSKEYLYKSDKSNSYTYKWEVVNGMITGANNKDTCHIIWDMVGNGYIKLIQTNNQSGCKDSSLVLIVIYPNITIPNIIGDVEVCPNIEMMYIGSSDENIQNEWAIENGAITAQNGKDTIFVKWSVAYTGKITLHQTSLLSHCKDSNSLSVSIYDLPQPIINGNSEVITNSKTIYRTQPTSKYYIFWTTDGGEIVGSLNNNLIEVIWGLPGLGSIKLLLIDKETGCQDSVILNIKIKADASKIITGDTLVCAYTAYTYSYSDTNYTKKWIADGGMIEGTDNSDSIEVFWEIYGTAKLILIRTNKQNQYTDTVELFVKIKSLPEGKIAGKFDVCGKSSHLYYTDAHAKYQRKWIAFRGTVIGDDTKDTAIISWEKVLYHKDSNFVTGRLVLILLDTTTGCVNNIHKTIVIYSNPSAEIIGDTVVCRNSIYSYSTRKDENAQISWTVEGGVITNNIGDTSIVIQWQSVDYGKLTLIEYANHGCADSVSLTIKILETPDKPNISQIGKELVSSSDFGNQWFLDDNEIPGAVEKKYKPISSGYYSVQVIGTTGCKSQRSNPYFFDVNDVNDKKSENFLVFFPNPVREFVILNINSDIYKEINVQIVNLVGKTIFDEDIKLMSNEVEIDLSDYATGLYIFVVTIDGDKKYYKRIVKL